MSTRARPVGCIADDITGAVDLASAIAGYGLDARLSFGSAELSADSVDSADAVVVALKIRSVPAAEARAAAVRAATALHGAGARRFFSKYCSTFDSTPEGNIGPIADALSDALGAARVVHSPSYPANGRTVYLGHLFVGAELLSDSPMRDHPLNPMRDARLQRVLAEQTPRPVEILTLPAVEAGAAAVGHGLEEIAGRHTEPHHVIVDAIRDADLTTIAEAAADDVLAAGAAAFGAAFTAAARRQARRGASRDARRDAPGGSRRAALPPGPTAILAGSLSRATREQVRRFDGAILTLAIDELIDGEAALRRARAFAGDRLLGGPVLIATDPDAGGRSASLAATPGEVSRRIESTMGRIARELEQLGARRLIIAGGETSGAVAEALGLGSARIGPDIAVGVPWIVADDRPLAVAFKSGNFGGPAFFRDALEVAGR